MDTKADIMTSLGLADLSVLSPAVAAWATAIEALPGVAETFPPHWNEAA